MFKTIKQNPARINSWSLVSKTGRLLIMKKLLLLLLLFTFASCSSLKRVDNQPQPTPAKSGFSWGGPVASGGGLDKGYWCDVKGGILTFGNSGPSEAKATEIAMEQCKKTIKDGSCKLVSCKHIAN